MVDFRCAEAVRRIIIAGGCFSSMETLRDRFAMWGLRRASSLILFAGISAVVAWMPAFAFAPQAQVVRLIAAGLLQMAAGLIVFGGVSQYLAAGRGRAFPNEFIEQLADERPPIGGWLIALALVLVALPTFVLLQLQPFFSEWRRVVSLIADSDMLRGANANGAGLVLIPVFGALTPPLLELLAAIAFPLVSLLLLRLLLARSPRFPRVYVAAVLLIAGVVFAAVRGSAAAMDVIAWGRRSVAASDARPGEAGQIGEYFDRYTALVSGTAPILAWTMAGYLIWVPAMFYSGRVRSTFSETADARVTMPERATDLETITRPPRSPG